MKIAIASDLHIEFDIVSLKNTENADLLILSGDIALAAALPQNMTDEVSRKLRKRFITFFNEVTKEFPRILYVMGNHEHYQGDFPKTAQKIRDFLRFQKYDNVTLLDKEHIKIDDITFFGATLWTDFNKEDPVSMIRSQGYMNDYRVITNSDRPNVRIGWERSYGDAFAKLLPDDTLREHKQTLITFRKLLDEMPGRVAFIGHHSPSFLSVHDDYKEDKYVNGAYHSSLEHFMEKYNNIELWVHGHTHYSFDYTVFNTRVVCNPRGYSGYEVSADNFKLKYIEL